MMLEAVSVIPRDDSIGALLEANPVVGDQRRGSRRFWTGREEKILRDNYPDGGVPACLSLLPGRTAASIYNRAGLLGLVRVDGTGRATGFPRKRWHASAAIDEVIRRCYQGSPSKRDVLRCAQTLGRPRWWVSKRAVRLGLVPPRFKSPPWSEDEYEIAAEHAHRDPAVIRRRLKAAGYDRSETAIMVMLKRRGTPTGANADMNHHTGGGLAKLMGVDAKTVTRWIAQGMLKADKRGTARTEAQGGDQWWISRRDVRRFIVENAAAVDIRKVDKTWFIDLLAGGRGDA